LAQPSIILESPEDDCTGSGEHYAQNFYATSDTGGRQRSALATHHHFEQSRKLEMRTGLPLGPRIRGADALYEGHHLIFPQASRDRETFVLPLAGLGAMPMKRSATIPAQIPDRAQKAVQDTAAGCYAFAAADLARAALMDTANGRQRLELSASSWTSRAELMQRLDDSFEARQAIAKAEWEEGEAAPQSRTDPDAFA
jgi:hypothetical protein